MFGGGNTFGSTNTGGFGATSTFGAAPNTSVFGGTGSTSFGAQQNKPAFGGSTFGSTAGGGGLFGSNTGTTGGGLFSTGNNAATSTFGAASNTTFGQPSTSFGGFGQTNQQQQQPSGGLFGSTSLSMSTPGTSGGLFGSQPTGSTFGGGTTSAFGGFGGGAVGAQQAGTGHIKFNPVTGTDTMVKSGINTNINTRNQCITAMKEYENKSLEELRFEDYSVGRKGGAGGAQAGGLFGSTQPQAGGGLFGSQVASTASGGMFGQQQNKPLFGTTGGAFGAATSAAPAFGAPATSSAFGAPAASTGGLFGAKPFGATTTTTGFGGGGFGQPQQQQPGGLFGAQNQQNKPFGVGAPQPQGGGLFGSTNTGTTGFGATAQPTAGGFGGFGQPQQQQQQIGLFGANQNQQKPAFGFGAAQPTVSSAAPSFGGFGSTTATTGGGLFGQPQQQKPAGFGGFGTTTTQANTGFGGFGAAASTGGGLFGANTAAKPAFSFGGTSTASSGFGGFGTANTGTSLFAGSTAAKPGGLFGSTGTGFGTGTGAFGTGATTGFGATTGTSAFGGGGLNFGTTGFGGTGTLGAAAPGAAGAPGQPPAASSAVQQQLLLALAASPFGDNPLFKTVSETGKRAEVLKGEASTSAGPSPGGKGLAVSQYKVAPHRNIKVKTKPVDSVNKSSMFDGLDDDLPGEADLFVPRSSVKKLVLRNKKNADMSAGSVLANTIGDNPAEETSLTVPLDESRLIVKKAAVPPAINNERRLDHDAEESFTSLNTRKKNVSCDYTKDAGDTSLELRDVDETREDHEHKDDGSKHPGGVVLNRAGYYTIPPLHEIELDENGKCIVEGFTIGREGYGNVHYPGFTDITGLNLDEIVFFRHKEVIVYPEEEGENKPELGEGLNKKAQITLDKYCLEPVLIQRILIVFEAILENKEATLQVNKVWPTDKNDSSLIKSPDKIRSMNFEDKLIRASTRLGAKFIEYRPETGSWVFKVEHFSKYGLDDSDEEEPVLDNSKKMKTLHLEKRGILDGTSNITGQPVQSLLEPRHSTINLDNQKHLELTESDGGASDPQMEGEGGEKGKGGSDTEGEGRDSEMHDMSSVMKQQTTLLRSALFSENVDIDGDISDFPAPKPVILQHRNTSMNQSRSRFIEDAPSSTRASLGGKSTLLGGSKFQGLGGSTLLSESMLNTTSLLRSHYSVTADIDQTLNESRTTTGPVNAIKKNNRLPSYSLTSGYDKFTQLQNSVIQDEPAVVTPQYVDTEVPLESSFLRKRFQQFADAGLFQNKKFRVGFGPGWKHMETPGGGYLNLIELENAGGLKEDQWEISSLQNWLQVALDNSNVDIDDEVGPMFSPVQSVETLQNHFLEVSNQLQECEDTDKRDKLWEMKHTLNLMMALWDTLEIQDTEPRGAGTESHTATMTRRELFSAWLEEGVQKVANNRVRAAREKSDHLGKVLGLLDGGDVEAACDALQEAGDHRAAMLLSQIGSGPNSQTSRLIQHQINRWREVQADRFIEDARLRLYSLIAGQPIQNGNGEVVNTLTDLDWQSAVAQHLWYLASPLASVPDSVDMYEQAWNSANPYCARPQPKYSEETTGCLDDGQGAPLDIKYHILKLYSDRILESLGYKMSSNAGHNKLCKEFASQLETHGLWHWAVFVLLHIQDPGMRQSSVEALLGRSVALEDEDSEARQDWILDTLRVPIPWLARAKAVLARVQGNQEELAEQLLKAEDWKEAHKVIVEELAPSAILSQEPHTLLHFLEQLSRDEDIIEQIPGWETEGKIYLEFLSVGSAVDRVLQGNRDSDPNMLRYEFERLKPLVTNLCRSIGNLPVNSSKQRLAQSEIAKQAAHYMRAVYSFESLADSSGGPGTTARQLAESLSSLALPEDYALQELRNLTRSYLSEIMES